MTGSESLAALCTEFWEWRMLEWPEFASFCGDHRYDDRLNDQTETAFIKRKETAKGFLERCSKFDISSLENTDQVTVQLLTEDLESFLKGIDTNAYVFPLSNMEGIHIEFEQLTSWMKFEDLTDFKKYTQRLQQLPKRLGEDIEMFELGIKFKKTFSIYCVEDVPGQLKALDKPVEETVYFSPFVNCKANLGPDLDTLKEQAKIVIQNDILPALRKLKSFIEEKYMPACRPTPGVWGMPAGRQFYEHVLSWHTSLPMSPQEVHDLGMKEVARIRAEMMQVLQKVGFQGDLKEFIQELKMNDKFYYNNKEDLLQGFRDMALNQIRPMLPKLFHKIPKSPLSIMAFPESKESGPAAYYLAGTLDGSRPGRFYVNAANLKNNAKFDMMTLTLHEGEPGHHFQGMYAIEATDLPQFRRYFEDMYYSVAPSRFGLHTAYGEGWGLYCEFLGKELGLYEDPYALFGHLSFEMFRACRLVADTGLHYFEWSFDKAVDLFLENTAMTKDAIVKECNRYCTIPGQACAYKIGQIRIQELREKASKALGDRFDVRDFHEEVLKVGMVPLSILESVINNYISNQGK